MTEILTLDEVKKRRNDLLKSFEMPEDKVYELARNYSLRSQERARFQKIEAYDFLLSSAAASENEEHHTIA